MTCHVNLYNAAMHTANIFESALQPGVKTVNGHIYTAKLIADIAALVNDSANGIPCARTYGDFQHPTGFENADGSHFLPLVDTIAFARRAGVNDPDGRMRIQVEWVEGPRLRESFIPHPDTHYIAGMWEANVANAEWAREHNVAEGTVYGVSRITGFTFLPKKP